VVCGATSTEEIQYYPASDMAVWKAAPWEYYKGKVEAFRVFEFVDQLVAPLPPRRVQLVRRYGVYARKVRNQWQQHPCIYRLAPEAWKQTHPIQSKTSQETPPVAVESTETPDAWCHDDTWSKHPKKEPLLSVCARSPPEPALLSVLDPKIKY